MAIFYFSGFELVLLGLITIANSVEKRQQLPREKDDFNLIFLRIKETRRVRNGLVRMDGLQ